MVLKAPQKKIFFGPNLKKNLLKGAQGWDIRSLGFSWFLHHKVFMGRWFVGKNINLLFKFLRELSRIYCLTLMLSIRVRSWCLCSACASGPDAYAQHAHQFLTRRLSMVCRDVYNERPFEKWKTDAYAEHTHQFLTRMLSMRTSFWCVCSAYAPVPDAYAQHTHKGRSIRVRKSNFLIIF